MAVEKIEYRFPSASRTPTTVHWFKWVDDSVPARAVLQMEHGVLENIAYYDDLATSLASRGYVVVADDHLGHGKTSEEHGLYITPDDAQDAMIQDMRSLYERVKAEYPNLPYFLHGHSMGSYMVRRYAVDYPVDRELAGILLMGSCWVPQIGTILQPFLKLFRKFGSGKGSPAVHLTRLPKPLTDLLSGNKFTKNIIYFVLDPYWFPMMTPELSGTSYCLVTNGAAPGWMKRYPRTVPTLILSGKLDYFGLFGYGFNRLERELKETGHPVDKETFDWFHNIHCMAHTLKPLAEAMDRWMQTQAS